MRFSPYVRNWGSNRQTLHSKAVAIATALWHIIAWYYYIWVMLWENLSSGVSTRYDSNRPAQLQRLTRVEILAIASRGIILSRQWTTKALIRLRRLICAFVVRIGHKRLFSWRGSYNTHPLCKSAYVLIRNSKCTLHSRLHREYSRCV